MLWPRWADHRPNCARGGHRAMRYLVSFVFNQPFDMGPLIGPEHDRIEELHKQGRVETDSLGADYMRGWVIMRGDSPDAIAQAFTTLPMYPYMKIEILPLAEHNII